MTMKIEVTIPEDAIRGEDAATYLAQAMSAIGFARKVTLPMPAAAPTHPYPDGQGVPASGFGSEAPKDAEKIGSAVAGATRERGKPSPGRQRRTKEEIAEDEAAEKAAEPVANISTGAERIDPSQVDDAEVVAQDDADEAAEVEEHRDEAKPLTVDDVKAVVGTYVAKYGMAAVQEDGPKIFVEALGTPPEGNAYWKMSILPADQEKLAHVIDVWNRAVAQNPLKREVVGA